MANQPTDQRPAQAPTDPSLLWRLDCALQAHQAQHDRRMQVLRDESLKAGTPVAVAMVAAGFAAVRAFKEPRAIDQAGIERRLYADFVGVEPALGVEPADARHAGAGAMMALKSLVSPQLHDRSRTSAEQALDVALSAGAALGHAARVAMGRAVAEPGAEARLAQLAGRFAAPDSPRLQAIARALPAWTDAAESVTVVAAHTLRLQVERGVQPAADALERTRQFAQSLDAGASRTLIERASALPELVASAASHEVELAALRNAVMGRPAPASDANLAPEAPRKGYSISTQELAAQGAQAVAQLRDALRRPQQAAGQQMAPAPAARTNQTNAALPGAPRPEFF